jgi:hypothetical protein
MQDELAEISIVTHKLVPNSSQNCILNPGQMWNSLLLSPHPTNGSANKTQVYLMACNITTKRTLKLKDWAHDPTKVEVAALSLVLNLASTSLCTWKWMIVSTVVLVGDIKLERKHNSCGIGSWEVRSDTSY